jgi:hypothetical protein
MFIRYNDICKKYFRCEVFVWRASAIYASSRRCSKKSGDFTIGEAAHGFERQSHYGIPLIKSEPDRRILCAYFKIVILLVKILPAKFKR